MITALILAGGIGSRVGMSRPKQFIEVLGKPVLAYTIELYQNHPEIDAIEVVCHADWIEYLKNMIQKYNLTKVIWIVHGGNTFQESVMYGIYNLSDKLSDDDIIMIHYGTSPFTSMKILNDGIRVCKEQGMSVSCTPCYQLVGSNDENGESHNWIDRDSLTQISCPQSFKYNYLVDIYRRAKKNGLLNNIDPHTTSLMYALGDTIFTSYGDQTNIKITTKEDFELFEGFVLFQQKIKNK